MNITKIAITGHTAGIGKHLHDSFSHTYKVLGFSRTSGYDISLDNTLKRIIEETEECEVFINNAYHYDQQTKLADMWMEAHRDKDHLIINMSSLASDPIFEIEKRMPYIVPYAEEKHRLNAKTFAICDVRGKCKAMSVLLGIVDTHFQNPYGQDDANPLEHYEDFKNRGLLINPGDVTDAIKSCLELYKNNCFIYSISILNRF